MSWLSIGNLSDISDKYQTNFGHKSGMIWLGKRQIKAVMYAKERGKITNKEYQELNEVSNKTAYLELTELVEKGVFTIEGMGKKTFYKVMKR